MFNGALHETDHGWKAPGSIYFMVPTDGRKAHGRCIYCTVHDSD
jgi:hypothetical protein